MECRNQLLLVSKVLDLYTKQRNRRHLFPRRGVYETDCVTPISVASMDKSRLKDVSVYFEERLWNFYG